MRPQAVPVWIGDYVFMKQEIWLPVPGFEDKYEVSDFGNVRQKFRTHKNLKPLRHIRKHTNYSYVVLYDTMKQPKILRIGRIVLAAFSGLNLRDKKSFACHKDDNGENNNLENLFIGSCSENMKDCAAKGRMFVPSGEKNGNAKFTNSDVEKMRGVLKNGASLSQVAKMFNTGSSVISRIKNGKSWKI